MCNVSCCNKVYTSVAVMVSFLLTSQSSLGQVGVKGVALLYKVPTGPGLLPSHSPTLLKAPGVLPIPEGGEEDCEEGDYGRLSWTRPRSGAVASILDPFTRTPSHGPIQLQGRLRMV